MEAGLVSISPTYKQSGLPHLVPQHPLDLIIHGFPARRAEMHPYLIGGLADLLHQSGLSAAGKDGIAGHILVAHGVLLPSNGFIQLFDTISFAAAFVTSAFSSRKFFPAKRIGAHRSKMRS